MDAALCSSPDRSWTAGKKSNEKNIAKGSESAGNEKKRTPDRGKKKRGRVLGKGLLPPGRRARVRSLILAFPNGIVRPCRQLRVSELRLLQPILLNPVPHHPIPFQPVLPEPVLRLPQPLSLSLSLPPPIRNLPKRHLVFLMLHTHAPAVSIVSSKCH